MVRPRVGFELPALEGEVLGYRLVGGRLCWLLDQRLGAFTYERHGRLITLYVLEAGRLDLAGAIGEPGLGPVTLSTGIGDYRSLVWHQGELAASAAAVREALDCARKPNERSI